MTLRDPVGAVAGVFERGGAPASEETLGAVAEALERYGYGRGHAWHQAHVALVQTRRTGGDVGAAPFHDGDLTVVADARLDARAELARDLGLDHRRHADAALIARAYRRWGRDCPEHLVGDFAFAVWDHAQNGLFCARDAVGARPLYLHQSVRRVVVASDARAVVAAGVPDDVDEETVARYLRNPVGTHPRATLFAEVQKLPPGRSLWVTAGDADERAYWHPFEQAEERHPDPADYAERLRELVVTAVQDRMPPSGAATHLSGGLDSSAVTVIAARLARQAGARAPLAVAWSPPVGEAYPTSSHDERARIDEIADAEGLSCFYPAVTAADYRRFLTRDLGATLNGLVIEWTALPQVAARGVQTVLSGWGGDEAATFDARGLLPDQLARGHWRQLARGLRHRWGRHPARWVPALRDRVVAPLLPDRLVARAVRAHEQGLPQPFAHPDLIQRTEALREPLDLLRERRGSRHMQRLLLENGHLTERMEAWTAWGAAQGVRYAYPLTDRRVLDFVYRVPVELHASGPYTRHLFRAAMEGVLPDELRWRRSKVDQAVERQRFQLRIDLWKALRAEVEAGLWASRDCPWVDVPRLRQAIQALPERLDPQAVVQFVRITSAVEVLLLWERRQQHGPAPRSCSKGAA